MNIYDTIAYEFNVNENITVITPQDIYGKWTDIHFMLIMPGINRVYFSIAKYIDTTDLVYNSATMLSDIEYITSTSINHPGIIEAKNRFLDGLIDLSAMWMLKHSQLLPYKEYIETALSIQLKEYEPFKKYNYKLL